MTWRRCAWARSLEQRGFEAHAIVVSDLAFALIARDIDEPRADRIDGTTTMPGSAVGPADLPIERRKVPLGGTAVRAEVVGIDSPSSRLLGESFLIRAGHAFATDKDPGFG